MDDDEIDAFLKLPKISPICEFSHAVKNMETAFFMASGVIVGEQNGIYRRGVTVEILCKSSKKLKRDAYIFTLFVKIDGIRRRIYQLDTGSYGLGVQGDHDWPHEHIGSRRIIFNDEFPSDFYSALSRFCVQTNISFEQDIVSPFEVLLK